MKIPLYLRLQAAGLMVCLIFCSKTSAQLSVSIRLDEEPFRYEQTQAENRISRLIAKLDSKDTELRYTEQHGYLRDLLKALEISESSQGLVFSKTSMQVQHITRLNPRAIFFNDDTYVAWIRGSSLIEISTVDPRLGAAFYSFEMQPWRVKLQRINDECLGCHASSMTQGIPGHVVRSVFPTADGSIDVRRASFVTNDASPFSERWGGWYVTGTHGKAVHMGNTWLQSGDFDKSQKGNLRDLVNEFDTRGYLSSHSDIVALMVLEHQTQLHNTFTKANFSARKILHERETIGDGIADDKKLEAEITILASQVVEQLLFCGEAKLISSVKGTTAFADEFTARGPFDKQGRSLRDFDLETRLFRFPCSYLIYSEAFDLLNPRLRNEILLQLRKVLRGENKSPKFKHLDDATRTAILSILAATKASLPAEWQLPASSAN